MGGGGAELASTREYESVAGGVCSEVLWNFGMSRRFKPKCAYFNEGNLAQFRRSAEK